MKNSVFLITLLIISFSSLLFAALNKTCHPQDQIAINKIQTAFGLTPTPNCCDWVEALTCSDVPPFRVYQLEIYDNPTSGQIPDAIGNLPFLEILQLHKLPNIIGNIPPAISKLANLSQLQISGTGLSGQIPSFLGNLTKLTSLEISGNLLITGPIPSFLSNLKNLITLDFTLNAFTGPIPAFLGDLKNLESLYLSNNALTGPIPPQLSQLRSLTLLDLHSNKLTGSIPESFGNFSSNLDYLYLSNCSLKGDIPKSLINMNINYLLDLSENSFTGDASFLFGKKKKTHALFLGSNKFKFDFSNVEFPLNLEYFILANNRIFGSIPKQLTQLKYLVHDYLDMSYNNLCGPIPPGLVGRNGAGPFSHNKCLCNAPLPPCKK